METHRLRAVVFQEDGFWVAQCLEYDVAAQARELRDICSEFERVIMGRLLYAEKIGVGAFDDIPPAPRRYSEMFEAAKLKVLAVEEEGFEITAKRPELELRAA